jgi:Fe-S-cluster containining protein
MAYQDGTKPTKETQLAASAIQTDVSVIKQLSQEHEDENWDFRSWLKQNAPDNIDGIVQALSQKYFALIDCKQCANCCRSLHAEFKKSELLNIAKTLGRSIEAFEKQFMSEGQVNPPCPMLDGKLCSIYENRPEVCRSYPHLEQPDFTFRLMGVIENVAICPIAFNAFEELKAKLRWSRGPRPWRR